MGNDEQALATALKEANLEAIPYIADAMTFKSNRALDLTNPAQLNTLGLTEAEIMIKITGKNTAYNITQIIGDIAKLKYDAIIFRSVQNQALKNIGIILR